MNRQQRIEVAQQTVALVDSGHYTSPRGARIAIAAQVRNAVEGTRTLSPEALAALVANPSAPQPPFPTRFEVANETTLAAAARLVRPGDDDVLCLNFASAKNPGGGFLNGSQAQEESLARSSALYATLRAAPDYYARNRACGTALYTDYMILSPDVPVFRDDEGRLLEKPYGVSFLTAPAVNAGAVHTNEPGRIHLIHPTMEHRAAMILAVAADAGYRRLVLGAWGCGVFRNLPADVAAIFARLLLAPGPFDGAFERVVFAVLDSTPGAPTIAPFRRHFGSHHPTAGDESTRNPPAAKGGSS